MPCVSNKRTKLITHPDRCVETGDQIAMGKPIRQKTVFVLGAGAHIPYGFPSGPELAEIMLGIHPTIDLSSILSRLGSFTDLPTYPQFATAFGRSGNSSIDAFIESRKDFADQATMLVMSILLNAEANYLSKEMYVRNNWFEYLWNALKCPPEEFQRHEITFLTFNYDRLIEYMIARSLSNSYGQPMIEMESLVAQSKFVVHLHGSLSPCDFNTRTKVRLPRHGFGKQPLSFHELMEAALTKPIRFFWEEHSNTEEWAYATQKLHEASRIYVLGVGSAVAPLKNLWKGGPKNHQDAARIFICVKNLRQAQAASIRNAMQYQSPPELVQKYADAYKPEINPNDGCLEVLGDHFDVNEFA